jgi:hypothetical protein
MHFLNGTRPTRNLRTTLQNSWHRPRSIATVPVQGYRFLPTGRTAANSA